MRVEGITGSAIPDMRGVPLPSRDRVDQPRREPPSARSGWFRRPSPEEFTREQLCAAGYGVVRQPKKPAQARSTSPSRPDPTRTRATVDHDLIRRLYLDEHLTIGEVAQQAECSVSSVRRSLDMQGVTIASCTPVATAKGKKDKAKLDYMVVKMETVLVSG